MPNPLTPFEWEIFMRLIEDGYSADDADALARAVAVRRSQLLANGGKRCALCHLVLAMSKFSPRPSDDGLDRVCRLCREL